MMACRRVLRRDHGDRSRAARALPRTVGSDSRRPGFCLTDPRTSNRAASRLAMIQLCRLQLAVSLRIQLRFASLPSGRRALLWSSGIRQTEPSGLSRKNADNQRGSVVDGKAPCRWGIPRDAPRRGNAASGDEDRRVSAEFRLRPLACTGAPHGPVLDWGGGPRRRGAPASRRPDAVLPKGRHAHRPDRRHDRGRRRSRASARRVVVPGSRARAARRVLLARVAAPDRRRDRHALHAPGPRAGMDARRQPRAAPRDAALARAARLLPLRRRKSLPGAD